MKPILTLIMLLISAPMFAQQNNTDMIVQEGKMLYRSEMASWNGTDLMLEKFKGADLEKIGGYFSYEKNSNEINCVFFNRDAVPKIIFAVTFDSTLEIVNARVNNEERAATKLELEYYAIRQTTLELVSSDSFFLHYKNTSLNIIPIIHNKTKKVYVLTGPKENGAVLIGNDYLLTFDDKGLLLEKKRLHKNLIPIGYAEKDKEVVATMHSHLPETGDYITATDICTLMLYEKVARWKQHYVISANYVSIWDCYRNQLYVLTKEAWEKIGTKP
ncbi:hypothetical protein [Chitinophaga sp. Cy-1792]|uniref:hypothetical protein n=1 Tax=Chitinophaga sp. Cy-1792 TaxID=2608339 RepID=UPI00142410A1|nr:hypothetical protein [Chitinophaga sp. Cy-1792]NIG55603.1 hypothetical protein [Chitinophaga sp. Cy-1792]